MSDTDILDEQPEYKLNARLKDMNEMSRQWKLSIKRGNESPSLRRAVIACADEVVKAARAVGGLVAD